VVSEWVPDTSSPNVTKREADNVGSEDHRQFSLLTGSGTSSASIDLLMCDRTPHKFGGIDGQSDEEENQTQGRGVDESDAC
jgi:hypothetical protein